LRPEIKEDPVLHASVVLFIGFLLVQYESGVKGIGIFET
jgi:hypothetical protein